MDLSKVLAQLREELANIDAAILSLENLQRERGIRPRTRVHKALSDTQDSDASLPSELPRKPSAG